MELQSEEGTVLFYKMSVTYLEIHTNVLEVTFGRELNVTERISEGPFGGWAHGLVFMLSVYFGK